MRRWPITVLVDAVIICFVLSLLASAVAQRAYGQAWGWIGVHGSSMQPTINDGSLVLCLPADPDELKVGDIVVFRSGDKPSLICHRIIERVEDGFRTRGDGTQVLDQQIGLPLVTAEILFGYVPQLSGKPIAIPLLGGLTLGGENQASQNIVVALGLSLGFLALGAIQPRRVRRRRKLGR